MSDKPPYARIMQTGGLFTGDTWQVYTLDHINDDGSATYNRWPVGEVVLFKTKEAAEEKAAELTRERASVLETE